MSDDDIFRVALGDVTPLMLKPSVRLSTKRQDNMTAALRRQAAEGSDDALDDPLSGGEHIGAVEPLAELSHQRPGVQNGVYKKLRLGQYPLEARLDLHRMTVETARLEVYQFVQDCLAHDVRCGLITHGKGEGRQQPAVLKSAVAHWLLQMPEVLAFHSALKRHGGVGSVYILLKKSERKRLENSEKY